MKKAKLYVLVTQMLIQVIVLLLLGYFIGYMINKESILKGILATIFGLCGLVFFVIVIIKQGEKDGN